MKGNVTNMFSIRLMFVIFFINKIGADLGANDTTLSESRAAKVRPNLSKSPPPPPPAPIKPKNATSEVKYDPSTETFKLVQMAPEASQPKPSEFKPTRPGNITSVSTGLKGGQNNPPINPMTNPLGALGSSFSGLTHPLRVLAHPLRNLVMMSFEGYRRLIMDAHRIENSIRKRFGLRKRVQVRSLDPLELPDPVSLEHRDRKIPILGKVVFTLQNIVVAGLSQFRVENLDGFGRNLYFQHVIPKLDSVANYSIDYHLFDAIPFRVSEGQLTATVPNAHVRGSFQVFPDILNVWFRVAQLNLSTWVDDVDIKFYPRYLISDRFALEKSTIDKVHTAFRSLLPNITDMLKLTYTKAIEMKLS